MENKILNKLIASIKWYDKDLHRVISSAKSACLILHQRGVSYKDFFLAAMTENPYITQILLKHAYKVGWMEEPVYDECKTMIYDECTKKMECFLDEKLYGPDFYESYEEKSLVYAATALSFNDGCLLEKTFKCVQKLLGNKEQGLLFSKKMFNILHYADTNTEYCALFYHQLYCYHPSTGVSI